MPREPTLDVEYAIKSYRYLRLTIVVMVLIAIVAVLAEEHVFGDDCWLRSFSAYYYTPVHAVFIGALATIGACLIAIKGTDAKEDVCLNIAGILAPIVAFVPTDRPGDACGSPLLVPDNFTSEATRSFVANSILTYAIVGLIVVGLSYLIAERKEVRHKLDELKREGMQNDRFSIRNERFVGFVIVFALTAGLICWYLFARRSFFENAHDKTAIAMFVAVGLAAWFRRNDAQPAYRRAYTAAVVVLIAGVVVPLLWKLVNSDFEHEVIWIEILELIGFGIFWITQSVEHWNLRIVGTAEPTPLATAATDG
jgi:uncharacterized membrane protein